MNEDPQGISEQLRTARQQRGLDLDEVLRHTGISLSVLTGLESERFDIVEPIFTRMALQSYAEYLGLDPAPLTDRFDQEQGPVAPPAPKATNPSQTPESWLPGTLTSIDRRRISLAMGGLLALILALVFFSDEDQLPVSQAPPPEPPPTTIPAITPNATIAEPEKVEPIPNDDEQGSAAEPESINENSSAATPAEPESVNENSSAATPAVNEQGSAAEQRSTILDAEIAATADTLLESTDDETQTITPPQPETPSVDAEPDPLPTGTTATSVSSPAGLVLEVEASDTTWVQISWDDSNKFEGHIPSGERRRFEASDHFLVWAGRAHSVRYWLDGELLGDGQLGEATKVLRFRASADGLEFLGPNFQPLTGNTPPLQP